MLSEQLQKKVNQSIRLLQSIEKQAIRGGDSQPIEIAYSGGKDSDVILQLAKEAGINYRAIYKNTTIDPPGTVKHAREMGAEVLMPRNYTFKQMIEEKGMPSRLNRFCCAKLKEYKILDKVVMGVRQEESKARKERYTEPTQCRFFNGRTKYSPDADKHHIEAIFPIRDWTDEDVKEFILDRGIKCAPVYYDEEGNFHVERRLGCMCCPMASYKKRLAEFREHPGMVKLYVKASQKFLDNHPNSKSAQRHKNAYEYFVHYVFYPDAYKWDLFYNGLFGAPDCKQFLEDYFKIKLD